MSDGPGISAEGVAAFERCIAADGVAIFPADTVYGLAAGAESSAGVERLYALKGRPSERPAAVMFFALGALLTALPELGSRTRAALGRLLPGAVTLVVPNPRRRFPLAAGPRAERLGVRVPELDGPLAPLRGVGAPVLQSSANRSGEPDARRLADVDLSIREGADVELDAGALPGTPSTVVDLVDYERTGRHEVLRPGAVPPGAVRAALDP